jgi:uncharacterized protein (TIGR02757 family)
MLGRALESLYARYDDRKFVDPDPLVFLYRYPDVRDREIAALVASSLAFGGVRQIMASVERVLSAAGSSPLDFVMNTPVNEMESMFGGFRHRWASGRDIARILAGAGSMIGRYGSLEAGFLAGMGEDDPDVIAALIRFSSEIVCDPGGAGSCLMPDPCRGSACKRLNLFLRWMIRSDNVDPGGWDGVPASRLVVPLDIHMHRFALLLGLTERKQANLAAAREITAEFAGMSPDDPVKYDFALTRLGIRRDDDREELLARLESAAAGK